MAECWLLADLGGTKTRVGLADQTGLIDNSTRTYLNADFTGLAPILQSYLAHVSPKPITALCAGVAGPVRNGDAQLTNLAWFIETDALRNATGAAHVTLINDLQAQAYALDDLDTAQVTPLFVGAPNHTRTRLVLGLGTGCNIAVAHQHGDHLIVPPSETGHTGLPHCTGELGKLIAHLEQRFAHRPLEAALSGPGLENIWAWLGGGDETPQQILAEQSQRSVKALHLFAKLLGRVAGDIALAHLPMAGLYLIGGTARAIAPHLASSEFHTEFTAKGPYTQILKDIPIALIEDDKAALRGCARCLRQTLG